MYKQTNIENAEEMQALANAIRQTTGNSTTPLTLTELRERVESWGDVRYSYLLQDIQNTQSVEPTSIDKFCLIKDSDIKRLIRNIKVQTNYGEDKISIAQATKLVQSITNAGSVNIRNRQSYSYDFTVIVDAADYYSMILDDPENVAAFVTAENRFETLARHEFVVNFSYACRSCTWWDVFSSPCYTVLDIQSIETNEYSHWELGDCGEFIFSGKLTIVGFPGETYNFCFGCGEHSERTLTVQLGVSPSYIQVGQYSTDTEASEDITSSGSFTISWDAGDWPGNSATTWHLLSSGRGAHRALRLDFTALSDYGRNGWVRYASDPTDALGDGDGDLLQVLYVRDLTLTYEPYPAELGGSGVSAGTMYLSGNYQYRTHTTDYNDHWESLTLRVGSGWPDSLSGYTIADAYDDTFGTTLDSGPSTSIAH